LNHIIGFTELVVDQQVGKLNEMQAEYLGDVLASSRHLLSLINDILDLSKVEAGKLDLEVGEIHLRRLLEGSLDMVKEKALKHRVRLSKEMDGIPEVIQADERKLKQILYNLLSNAVKFTPDGGVVTLAACRLFFQDAQWRRGDGRVEPIPFVPSAAGEWVKIAVRDTGIGLKAEDLERVFAPFEQADTSVSRKYQGTGLGLSLTRRLVELHGGKIWAESEGEGKGSVFRFLFPVAAS
jgi:signal transduction histidine kinase